MKKSTKVIVSSVLSMALCASLIAGSTFALFSSEADVNVAITAGKVDVKASVTELAGFSALWSDGSYIENPCESTTDTTGTFTTTGTWSYEKGKLQLSNIAPGDGVTFKLNFTNASTIAIKYRVQLTVPEKQEGDIAQDNIVKALEVSIGGSELTPIGDRTTVAQKWSTELPAGAGINPVDVKIKLPITDGDQNEYQGQGCEINVGVYAVQANAHVVDPEGAFIIYNASDLYTLAASVNGGTTYEGQTVSLANDIYLSKTSAISTVSYTLADVSPTAVLDKPWTPIGDAKNVFMGTFDGHGCTIYGLKAEGSDVALFGKTQNAVIQNVTIASADITATSGSAGTLVAVAEGKLTVSNVTVKDSTVKKEAGATVGGLVGTADGTITVSGVDVQLNESEEELGGTSELVGSGDIDYKGDKNEAELELSAGFVERINYKESGDPEKSYEVSTAEGLAYFAKTVNGDGGLTANTYENFTVKLVKDIDLRNEPWTPIGVGTTTSNGTIQAFHGTLDGNSKTIRNLTITAKAGDSNWYQFGFFAVLSGANVYNFTIENASVEASNGHGVGVVAAEARNSTIDAVTVKGNIVVDGLQYVGGIVGHSTGATITNCTVSQNTGSGNGIYIYSDKAGGIAGYASAGEVNSNTVTNVTLGTKGEAAWGGVGGVVGCYASATGTANDNTLTDVVIDVTGMKNEVDGNGEIPATWRGKTGAVAGNGGAENNCTLTFGGNQGNVTIYTDGFAPELKNGGIVGSGLNVIVEESNTVNVNWDGLTLKMDGWHVATAEQLKRVAYFVNEGFTQVGGLNDDTVTEGYSFSGETVYLDDNINLEGENWVAIGSEKTPFKGIFDGNGHTVTYNITKNNPEVGYYGLFGYITNKDVGPEEDVVVKNVVVDGSITMTGNAGEEVTDKKGNQLRIGGVVGGIGGSGIATIQNCVSLIDFDFSDLITHWYVGGCAMNFGGVVGDASYVKLENLVFAGSVALNEDTYVENGKEYPGYLQWSQAASNIGGIVGNVSRSVMISHCLNLGQTKYFEGTSGGAAAGGIAGRYSSNADYKNELIGCYSLTIRCIGYDAGNSSTGGAGNEDAFTEQLTRENWESVCKALSEAGWTWNDIFNCPAPELNA